VANGWIVHPRCEILWNAKHTITNSLYFLTYQLIFILAFIIGDGTRQILTTGKNHPQTSSLNVIDQRPPKV